MNNTTVIRPGVDVASGRCFLRGSGLALRLCLLSLCLLVASCATAPLPVTPPPAPADARDLLGLSQDLNVYLAPASLDRPLIAPATQQQMLSQFRTMHYGPWVRSKPVYSRQDALWGLGMLPRNRHYGENLRLLGPGFRAEMEALVQANSYPNAGFPAIATANTSLRVLPTIRPGFLKPTQPGEGFPFDYWQNSGIWAGTPVYVSHVSADGAWSLVETRFAGGWVRTSDLATVDEAFMSRWLAQPLLAVTREHVSIFGEAEPSFATSNANATQPAAFLFQGRIGTVLPLSGQDDTGYTVLVPARGTDGRAVLLTAHLAQADAAPMPLAPTPRNFALLANQMMGQPYGWGGYLENRDCSALLLDLYTPFGVFMPRNSRQQARTGAQTDISALTPEQKQSQMLSQGVPLLTLLHKPGHIMLYIGQGTGAYAGRALIYHAAWGLKTRDAKGAEGRFVIGRTAITTVQPGRELPEVARVGTLLDGIDSMTFVAPLGGTVVGNDQGNGQTGGQ